MGATRGVPLRAVQPAARATLPDFACVLPAPASNLPACCLRVQVTTCWVPSWQQRTTSSQHTGGLVTGSIAANRRLSCHWCTLLHPCYHLHLSAPTSRTLCVCLPASVGVPCPPGPLPVQVRHPCCRQDPEGLQRHCPGGLQGGDRDPAQGAPPKRGAGASSVLAGRCVNGRPVGGWVGGWAGEWGAVLARCLCVGRPGSCTGSAAGLCLGTTPIHPCG